MRIAMLLDSAFHSDTRVEKEAEDLIRAGHQVSVICMREEGAPANDERMGIPVRRRFHQDIKSPFRRSHAGARDSAVAAILAEEYDALHCHDYHMLSLGVLAKERRPRPLIYDAHEFLSGWPFYKDSPTLSARLKGRLVWAYEVRAERRNVPMADHVVTVSNALSEAMVTRFDLTAPPIVVRNIPRPYEVRSDSKALRARFGIPPDTRVVLYSGAMYHTDRQLKALYGIIDGLRDTALLILGSWPRHAEAANLAKALGHHGRSVFFGDYIPDPAERQDVISGADVALMHVRSSWKAHRLTFSNKFLEYTFAGLPIVAAFQEDCVAIGARYGHALFYEEDDDATLKRNIERALTNAADMRAGLSRARQDFSWEEDMNALLDLYGGLA